MINFLGKGKGKKALLPCVQVRLLCACGELVIEANPLGLTGLRLANRVSEENVEHGHDNQIRVIDDKVVSEQEVNDACQHLMSAVEQLEEYFIGQRQAFELELAPYGTEFQHQVWHALVNMDYGLHCSYGEIANQINNPKAVRAVGAANGANPIAIIVPCHRVIGKDGSLTGYAYGLEMKKYLLNLEGVEV